MSVSMSRGLARLGCCEITIFALRSFMSSMIQLESKALSAIKPPNSMSLIRGRDADGVKAMAGEQDEPHQIPKCVGQRKDFGGPAALRLADGLIFGPPFAPCAWR